MKQSPPTQEISNQHALLRHWRPKKSNTLQKEVVLIENNKIVDNRIMDFSRINKLIIIGAGIGIVIAIILGVIGIII